MNDNDFIKQTEELYDSLKKKETFSPLMQEQIKSELERIKKEAQNFYKQQSKKKC